MTLHTKLKQLLTTNFAHLGFEETIDATLIGKAPQIGDLAWNHIFYRGLSKTELEEIENSLNLSFPVEIKTFYLESNGLTLFNTALNLNGIRRKNSRDPLNQQPYSIYTGNQVERPENAKPNYLFFASYGYDLTRVFVDTENGKVYACERWNAKKVVCPVASRSEVAMTFPLASRTQ